jgi:hypothetical protein
MSEVVVNSAGIVVAAIISGVAAYYAAKAEKNSRPVGNGFTNEIRDDLKELRELLTTHLRDHANKR